MQLGIQGVGLSRKGATNGISKQSRSSPKLQSVRLARTTSSTKPREIVIRSGNKEPMVRPHDRCSSNESELDLSLGSLKARQSPVRDDRTSKIKSLEEQCLEQLSREDYNPAISGKVRVLYNHYYNKEFVVKNGVLKWEDIDNEYAISFVFCGNYKRQIFLDSGGESAHMQVPSDEHGRFFLLAQSGDEGSQLPPCCYLKVLEDPAAGAGNDELLQRGTRLGSSKT